MEFSTLTRTLKDVTERTDIGEIDANWVTMRGKTRSKLVLDQIQAYYMGANLPKCSRPDCQSHPTARGCL